MSYFAAYRDQRFRDNSGVFAQGILHCVTCTIVLEGYATFVNNTGTVSGVLSGGHLNLSVNGNTILKVTTQPMVVPW